MLDKETSTELLRQLEEIRHPEIDCTLVELGMLPIDEIDLDSDSIAIPLKLPMLGIPEAIKNILANSIQKAIDTVDPELEGTIKLSEMDQDERMHFFSMARAHWKQ